jgi:hypothetical protein
LDVVAWSSATIFHLPSSVGSSVIREKERRINYFSYVSYIYFYGRTEVYTKRWYRWFYAKYFGSGELNIYADGWSVSWFCLRTLEKYDFITSIHDGIHGDKHFDLCIYLFVLITVNFHHGKAKREIALNVVIYFRSRTLWRCVLPHGECPQ